MNHDQLFLLKPDVQDRGKTYFCPSCAEIVGLLEFYPALKQRVDVHYVDFPRPRPELAPLLGEENQSCPVLVLKSVPGDLPSHLAVRHANGQAFVEGAREIAEYLAHVQGTGIPH